mmetsp:Transcript_107069/g.301299  ORF Transcript_107069/g.301299 Transcript_107069/m.301299 type:complete len:293 (+) Transcript_107069:359-1237(+)
MVHATCHLAPSVPKIVVMPITRWESGQDRQDAENDGACPNEGVPALRRPRRDLFGPKGDDAIIGGQRPTWHCQPNLGRVLQPRDDPGDRWRILPYRGPLSAELIGTSRRDVAAAVRVDHSPGEVPVVALHMWWSGASGAGRHGEGRGAAASFNDDAVCLPLDRPSRVVLISLRGASARRRGSPSLPDFVEVLARLVRSKALREDRVLGHRDGQISLAIAAVSDADILHAALAFNPIPFSPRLAGVKALGVARHEPTPGRESRQDRGNNGRNLLLGSRQSVGVGMRIVPAACR